MVVLGDFVDVGEHFAVVELPVAFDFEIDESTRRKREENTGGKLDALCVAHGLGSLSGQLGHLWIE
jgi:hypothetical protein